MVFIESEKHCDTVSRVLVVDHNTIRGPGPGDAGAT
jgi:hypothetical protein